MTTTSNIRPTVGRIVIYESKNGDGIISPAIILRTQETTNLEVLKNWKPESGKGTLSGKGRPADLVPELSSRYHVDLAVFGLGGEYRQFNVPFSDIGGAHTWNWPARV